jgi:outer membrane lipopolysaccharide assembly protein LptE/RlpB
VNKVILIFLLPLLLTACGWQLQGARNTSTLQQINLGAKDIYTPLYRTFKQEFEHRRIELVSDESAPRLQLLSEQVNSRIVSYNTEIDPAEDEMTLTIYYLINDQPFQAREIQTYQRNKNRVAARENEKAVLIDQMRRQLADKILRHMTLIYQPKTTVSP